MSFTDAIVPCVQDPLAQIIQTKRSRLLHKDRDHPFPFQPQRPEINPEKSQYDTFRITRYWMKHDSAWDRRHLNKEFRLKEKQYFRRFGEFLRKCKSRGWKTW
ncbi:MAG: hypothetical protein A4E34_02833 [Methanoregula sp. PtaU1.Bin006]|nr:MAG: hypothetical protein A4E33_02290 [Methanoregula sp. PtaB.Bin085]OPY31640.1 MAG: hypothetical protein A4E34_02833 [Methanoregula sp. PtaU1.Bin006]